MKESREQYEKFFNSALAKFGVKSPDELKGEKKKEFFNYVDDNYKSQNESTKAYAKTLAKMAKDRQLQNISKKDKETLMKIALMMKNANEIKEDKEAYQKFFNSALEKFGIDSPAELDDDKKKEFFNYVDDNYKSANESTRMMKQDNPRFETYKLFIDKALKNAGIKVVKFKPMDSSWLGGKNTWGAFYHVKSAKGVDVLPFYIDKKGYIDLGVSSDDFIVGRLDKFAQVVKNLKDFKKADLDESFGLILRNLAKHAAKKKMYDKMKKKRKKESVAENKKRVTFKEIYKWMKTLEEYRYRKVPAVDIRRIASFVNNGIKEADLPQSLQKKWAFAEYGREKHLANKFLKAHKVNEDLDPYKDFGTDNNWERNYDLNLGSFVDHYQKFIKFMKKHKPVPDKNKRAWANAIREKIGRPMLNGHMSQMTNIMDMLQMGEKFRNLKDKDGWVLGESVNEGKIAHSKGGYVEVGKWYLLNYGKWKDEVKVLSIDSKGMKVISGDNWKYSIPMTMIKKKKIGGYMTPIKESVNEGITVSGYSELSKRGRYLPMAAKEFLKSLKQQDDAEVIKYIEYIYDLMEWMKMSLKNKKYNESINEKYQDKYHNRGHDGIKDYFFDYKYFRKDMAKVARYSKSVTDFMKRGELGMTTQMLRDIKFHVDNVLEKIAKEFDMGYDITEDSEFTMKIDSYQNAMNALDKYVDVLRDLGLKKKSAAALKLLKNLQKIMFQKEMKEVSSPLVQKLNHAIDDVEELLGVAKSDQASDAFEKPKPSMKALTASLKLLNKVK